MMNLRRILMLVVLLAGSAVARAQNGGDVLFTVGGTPVTVDEFKYIYEKNNASDKNLYSDKNLKEYLDLYTNFKLKVKEAHELGMDTTDKFLDEYNRYRNQLAQPYLTDREVTQQLIDEAYKRLKWEIRASHILISVPNDASPKDTLAAYNKAMEARERALKGEDFEKLAREYSKDPSVQHNGGDLGYFTAFHMIYPFESAAFALQKPGDISMPVRTQFGYHIIKLADRRPYRGEIQVRHILITTSNNDPAGKQATAKAKIDSLYSQLQKGVPFQDLARQYSDHVQSRSNGGELPAFNSFSQYPEEFKDAAFALTKDGEYSKPFRSAFGWHLVQRISLKDLQSEKELEEYLKQRIARDSRSEKSMEAAISRFKKDYGFAENAKNLKKFNKLVDTTLLKGSWTLKDASKASKPLFVLDGKNYTQKDFADFIQKNEQPGRFTDVKYAVQQYYHDFVNQTVYNYQDKNLEKKYADFRNVANEYREGILLFAITDQKVWGKAMSDTTGLEKFYESHKENYRWKERADAVIVDLRDKAAVADVKKQLTAGKSIDAIADAYVKKDPLSLNYKQGLFEKGENPILDQVKWQKGVYDAGTADGRYYVIKVNDVKQPSYKELKEIRGLVIADYQDYLEKEWIKSLKAKYPVTVNQDVLNKLIQSH